MLRDLLLIALLALALFGFVKSPTVRGIVSGRAFRASAELDQMHCKCGENPRHMTMEGVAYEK